MARSTSKKAAKQAEPMDSTVRENQTPAITSNNPRVCYAAKTLVAEIDALFPETPVEFSNIDGRNTALDVSFDLTTLDAGDRYELTAVLQLLDSDVRVAEVIEDNGQVLVSFKPSLRTQDSRESFGIADALDVLAESDAFESEGSL